MPGLTCAVSGCKNCWKSSKDVDGEKLTFHSFPKEKDQTLRNKWIKSCQRSTDWNPANARICSIHFHKEDYERDLQNEILGLPLRKRLKKNAFPTLNLPDIPEMKTRKRGQKRKINTIANVQDDDEASTVTENNLPNTPNLEVTSYYELKYNELVSQHDKLKESFSSFEKSNKMKVKLLSNNLRYYKKKCMRLGDKLDENKSPEKMLLKQILTENQIALLMNKKKRVNWTQEEISTAFTLRYYSKKCYLHIRDKLKYPLPGLSTLKRWASKMNIGQGILKNILTFMQLAGESMNNSEKTVVISFDEVEIKSLLNDNSLDKIASQHNYYMQVVMARGIFSNWKQPIYLGFDEKMTKQILHDVITELHNISFNVVACVSKYGGNNINLWNDLNINIDNPYFNHPQTNNEIYMFADASHLLLMTRNWFLDTGFKMEDEIINKKPVECLIYEEYQVLGGGCNISAKHVEPKESQRHDISLATELFSNAVGEALIQYKPGDDEKLAENVGIFICEMSNWFNIFNSYVKDGSTQFECAYGVHLLEQECHLNNLLEKITLLRANGKNGLVTFQRGMIVSIQSLKLLFHRMKEKHQIGYLCTFKLTHDCLENFLFQISTLGPNDHPSPMIMIKRMRQIMLGRSPEIFESLLDSNGQPIEEYLSSKVMVKANVEISAELANHASSQYTSLSSHTFCDTSFNNDDDAFDMEDEEISEKIKEALPDLGQHIVVEIDDGHNHDMEDQQDDFN